MWAWWLNTAWMVKNAAERARFARACRRVRQTQADVLRRILHANRDSWFGRRHGFADIDDPAGFQRRVPPMTYDDYAPLVARIAAGEGGVLTSEPVLLLEPTSGSSGGEKLIPYTAGLRRQFQRGVSAWIADLLYHRSAVRAGRAYWSISPALGPPRRSSGGLPIGFDDDAAYLGRFEQFALRKLLVVPGDVAKLPNLDAFRRATLGHLLAADDLALISVWSPTFLTAMIALLDDPDALIAGVDGARGQRLRAIWRGSASLPDKLRQTWPRLALISCWTDAAAEHFVPELTRLFPHVEIQGKGLLATEAFVSLPLIGQPAPALALRSHFFEFEETATGRIVLADRVERGGRYRVIVTTAGGLYRYQLRDEVEIAGFLQQCPLARFLGKCDLVSDLVGEKLAEEHVRAVLARLCARWAPRFLLLVPVLATPPRYRLYMQSARVDAALEAELQIELEANPYYRHAVGVGQLAPVEIAWLDPDAASAWTIYEAVCMERGQKCGDIKPVALDRWRGWPDRFAPLLVAADKTDTRPSPAARR